jgi:hypothetical protein
VEIIIAMQDSRRRGRARERGIRWGGSIRVRRIRATVEQIAVIRRLRPEGGETAATTRATGLFRPTIYRILAEDCNASSGFSDGGYAGAERRHVPPAVGQRGILDVNGSLTYAEAVSAGASDGNGGL